ncbi:MAG: T9SS type A sorting domain-containing protein [Marinilabiliaceae bacterium]|nr:T9SS type A sorting domain-containing protein [Marinilabiliaceae bacterium]
MKKVISTLFAVGLLVSLSAQTTLTYKTHGLIPDEKNPMLLTKYVEPGVAGKNVVWDFTALEMTNSFVGNIDQPQRGKSSELFLSSNSVLEEFGNFFYFDVNKNDIKHYGYASGSGNTTIEYRTPFIKMKYPFRYGNSYKGEFDGVYNVRGEHYGDIIGNYSVTADGTGTLILPGGVKYPNALRVKEVKSYTNETKHSTYDIVNETFRWYVNEHRFPILVLIKSTYTDKNGRTSSSTQAAYNPVIITNDLFSFADNNAFEVNVYPNPYVGQVNISFDVEEAAFVNVSVYTAAGTLVAVLANQNEKSGTKEYKFSAKQFGVGTGSYVVKVTVGENTVMEKILEL